MAKINHEEYKMLKGLDKEWEWIARDKNRCLYVFTGKPVKKYGPLLYWGTEGFLSFELFDEKELFQFIQWEDEKPYSISELMEEYEIENDMRYNFGKIKVVDIDTSKLATNNDFFYVKESEETEVKNIEWFKEEFYKAVDRAKQEPMGGGGELKYVHIDYIKKIIDQLDEPEVLSEEWIERNTSPGDDEGRLYVWKSDLQNAIVPKQKEVKRAQIPEWIIEWYQGANNEFSTLEDVFDNLSHDTGYSIVDSEKFRSRIMEYGGYSKMYEALSHIYFGAYEIEEEEPKYYALIKGHENISSGDKYWNYCITDQGLDIGDNEVHTDVLAEYVLSATKDEWENLGINNDNADFVKVEELEE